MSDMVGMYQSAPPVYQAAPSQHESKEQSMEHPVEIENVFKPAAGHDGNLASAIPLLLAGGVGGNQWGGSGLTQGLLGGLLGGALFGGRRGGLFGGDGDGAGAGAVALQGSIDTNTILQGISNLNAAVPLSQAQVQLTVANAAASLGNQATALNGQTSAQLFQGQLASAQGFAATKDAVDALSTQTAIGFGNISREIATNGWLVTQAINNDGEKTRALVGQIDRENLNRLITTQASELVELRNESARGRDRHGIEISMVNNQNQNQMQFQQQAQVLGQLSHLLNDVSQVARATNSNVIVGNTGATTTGAMTANPTNVNTR